MIGAQVKPGVLYKRKTVATDERVEYLFLQQPRIAGLISSDENVLKPALGDTSRGPMKVQNERRAAQLLPIFSNTVGDIGLGKRGHQT